MNLKEEVVSLFRKALKETIENLEYLQDLMSREEIKDLLKETFRDELRRLQFLGLELPC